MGVKLSAIDIGERIKLQISTEKNHITLDAIMKAHIKDNIVLVFIAYAGTQRLVFDNVKVDVEYEQSDDVPIIWHNARIASYKTDYVIQVPSDGTRHNRRNCFRVSVGMSAKLINGGRGAKSVMIRDVSLSGFAITDRKKDLKFSIGDSISVSFMDLGHNLDLTGHVVRIEEHEEMTIYGLETSNLCKDLSSYVNLKQRRNKKAKDGA